MLLPPAYLHAHPSGPPPTGAPLILTFTTTGADETCQVGAHDVGTYDATINWGDGSGDQPVVAFDDANLSHVYASPDTHTVTITGDFPSLAMGSLSAGLRGRLSSVEQWGETGFLRLDDALADCPNVAINATDAGDFGAVTTFAGMFRAATSVVDVVGLENWNVSAATSFAFMFQNMTAAMAKTLNWSTPLLTDLTGFCSGSSGVNLNVAAFDVADVIDAQNAFEGSGISDANYDALLGGWAPQAVQSGATLDLSHAKYTDRTNRELLRSKGWTLNDYGWADAYIWDDFDLSPEGTLLRNHTVNIDALGNGWTNIGEDASEHVRWGANIVRSNTNDTNDRSRSNIDFGTAKKKVTARFYVGNGVDDVRKVLLYRVADEPEKPLDDRDYVAFSVDHRAAGTFRIYERLSGTTYTRSQSSYSEAPIVWDHYVVEGIFAVPDASATLTRVDGGQVASVSYSSLDARFKENPNCGLNTRAQDVRLLNYRCELP